MGMAVRTKGSGRALGAVLYVLTGLFLAAAWALDYFGHTRMGMARHLVYMNRKWSARLPIDELRIAAVALVVVLLVALVAAAVARARAGRLRPPAVVAGVVAALCAVGYVWYTLAITPDQVRAAIVVSPLLGLAALAALTHGLWLTLWSSRTHRPL